MGVKYLLGVQKVVIGKSSSISICSKTSFSGDSTLHENSFLRCTITEESQDESTTTANETITSTPVTMANVTDSTGTDMTTENGTDTSTDADKGKDPTGNPTTSATNARRLTSTAASNNNFCKFPFQVKGITYWDCIPDDEGRGKVCNVEQKGREMMKFNNTSTFQLCGKCKDSCTSKSNHSYAGFNLTNKAGPSKYRKVTSWEDCQQLCQFVDKCNFFNYHTTEEECELMYGVGEETQGEVVFGQKFCPGKHLIYYVFSCNLLSTVDCKTTIEKNNDTSRCHCGMPMDWVYTEKVIITQNGKHGGRDDCKEKTIKQETGSCVQTCISPTSIPPTGFYSTFNRNTNTKRL